MYPDDPVGVFTAVQCAARTMRFALFIVIFAGPTTASSRRCACCDPVAVGAKLSGKSTEVRKDGEKTVR
jgi:hypothetical protein